MKNQNQVWSNYWSKKRSFLKLTEYTPTYINLKRYFRSLDIPKDAKILDAGCGTGKLASFWTNEGYDVIGIDLSDKALEITGKKGVKTCKADILEGLSFEDDYFDLVYSDGLLEHFEDPEPILRELFRVSNTYILTLVPRIELYSQIMQFVLKPPKEYKRADSEWINIHERLKPGIIHSKAIKFGVLSILCGIT
ncbi:class I SAM-dependent methyltransferase [Methanobacterium sp. MBAC-LM]|uniref:class I SAM-dependent methyltransferase n=1 Tax=Methanobacterium sp. MBAC-LM TaxID=3412034 RepID=UPI003C73B64C